MLQPRGAKEWRALIGKTIRYHRPGSSMHTRGVVEEVKGKNVRVDGDWYWFGSGNMDIVINEVLEGKDNNV